MHRSSWKVHLYLKKRDRNEKQSALYSKSASFSRGYTCLMKAQARHQSLRNSRTRRTQALEKVTDRSLSQTGKSSHIWHEQFSAHTLSSSGRSRHSNAYCPKPAHRTMLKALSVSSCTDRQKKRQSAAKCAKSSWKTSTRFAPKSSAQKPKFSAFYKWTVSRNKQTKA